MRDVHAADIGNGSMRNLSGAGSRRRAGSPFPYTNARVSPRPSKTQPGIIRPMSEIPGEPLPVGARAPHFSLRRTFKESVDLGELLARGAVVVVFYVFDFGDI